MRPTAALLAALLVVSTLARAGDHASGSFASGPVSFEIGSAVAFRARSSFDQADAIVVAVSNGRINAEGLAAYADRRLAIERRFRDDQTVVVYLEFRPNGQYRGLSYLFGSGNGCAFCSGEVTSTARLAGNRVVGSLRNAEKNRPFDIALDVPLLPDAQGAPLPADGGAPGNAYRAYHAALALRDTAALKSLLSASNLETMARAEKQNATGAFLDSLAEDHPTRAVSVRGGYATADRAVVLVAGEGVAGRMRGEAVLVREKGAWRVDDEIAAPAP